MRAALQRRIEAREGIVMAQFEPHASGPRITQPTLVVHDRGDRINPFADGTAFADTIPGARLLATEGLGHTRLLRDALVAHAVHATHDLTKRSVFKGVASVSTPSSSPADVRAGRLASEEYAKRFADATPRFTESQALLEGLQEEGFGEGLSGFVQDMTQRAGTIRRAIAKDLDKLKALPSVDSVGLALRLDNVMAQVDTLPMLADEKPTLPAAPEKKARATARQAVAAKGGKAASAPVEEGSPWLHQALRGLAKLKFLRGTPLDPFGHTAERKMERALIDDYQALVEELLQGLDKARLPLAVELAQLPEQIRGYGHVKARHLADVRARWATLLAQWRAPSGQQRAA
eukprot:gene44224-54076_t